MILILCIRRFVHTVNTFHLVRINFWNLYICERVRQICVFCVFFSIFVNSWILVVNHLSWIFYNVVVLQNFNFYLKVFLIYMVKRCYWLCLVVSIKIVLKIYENLNIRSSTFCNLIITDHVLVVHTVSLWMNMNFHVSCNRSILLSLSSLDWWCFCLCLSCRIFLHWVYFSFHLTVFVICLVCRSSLIVLDLSIDFFTILCTCSYVIMIDTVWVKVFR